MSARGHEGPAALRARDEILIKYAGYDEWHARILLSEISPSLWVVVTPDADIYPEDLGATNRDIEQWRRRIVGRPLPYGIRAGSVYDFDHRPAAGDLDQLCAEADIRAAMVRASSPGLDDRRGPDVEGSRALGADPDRREPDHRRQAGGEVGGRAEAAGGDREELLAALGENRDIPAASTDDARTLSIRVGEDGQRHRDFRDSITLCKQVEFNDWPVRGPRSTGWLVRQLAEGGHTPIAHHARFVSFFRLSVSDPIAMQHEAWSKVLQTMVCYDQVDVLNLASAELVCRQLQLIEDRMFQSSDNGASSAAAEESSLYMGTSTAHGAVLVSPDLKGWIAGELAREASVLKERRKAREERTLARGSDSHQGEGGKGSGGRGKK